MEYSWSCMKHDVIYIYIYIYIYTRVIQKVNIQHGGREREITADHPAQSPSLTPSDFHLFLHLKKHLAGQKFHEDE
jgi:hypothetical protein